MEISAIVIIIIISAVCIKTFQEEDFGDFVFQSGILLTLVSVHCWRDEFYQKMKYLNSKYFKKCI